MSDRIALIQNNKIVNVVLANLQEWQPPQGFTAMLESEAISQGMPHFKSIPEKKIWENTAEFLSEFSMEQLATISLSTDPTIAALRLFLSGWRGEVWGDDPRVIAGLEALVANSIITNERRIEIISI